jgi:hypothetical protein
MNDIGDVRIEELDEYLEAFYEDNMDAKVLAAKRILFLTLDLNNLEILMGHGMILTRSFRIS